MSDTNTQATPAPQGPQLMGHPAGLFILFGAEMWERFCFYGMRTLLVLYMVQGFLAYDDPKAYGVYGSYNSLVYLTPILGGLLADKLLGYRKAIMLGAVFMALGEFALLVQQPIFFYAGMAMLIVGNGFFKPNISTIVGKLYPDGDPRRDGGFTIFYMGINIGAFLSTTVCGYIGERFGWHYGFGLAGIGMLLGLVIFSAGGNLLLGKGDAKDPAKSRKYFPLVILGSLAAIPIITLLLQNHHAVEWLLLLSAIAVFGYLVFAAFREEIVQRHKMFVIIVLAFFHMVFWSFFEQAGSSLTLFTERNVDRDVFGWEFPTTWGQSFNPIFIVLFAPIFAALWIWLSKRRMNPSIPNKFTLGLLQVGLGFAVLVVAAKFLAASGFVPLWTLVFCYLLHTTGELCLSPVGLSMVTKLAPARMTGLVMGAWFLSIAGAHSVAAFIARLTGGAGGTGETVDAVAGLGIYSGVFMQIFWGAMIAAVALFALSPILKKWLHGVE